MKSVMYRKKQYSGEKINLRKMKNPFLEVSLDISLMLLRLTELFLEFILKHMQKLDVKIEKILEKG